MILKNKHAACLEIIVQRALNCALFSTNFMERTKNFLTAIPPAFHLALPFIYHYTALEFTSELLNFTQINQENYKDFIAKNR